MSAPVQTLAKVLERADVFVDGDWVESKDQDLNGDVRLVQLADIGDGYYIDKSNRFLTSDTAKRLKCTFLKAGDILVARMPDPIGRACIFPGDAKPCVTVVDVCVIRVKEAEICARWLMHTLNSPLIRNQIAGFATGTTRSRVSRGNLSKITLAAPPLPEQRRIAAILDKADTLRTKRREALAQIDRLAQSIFVEMFGTYTKNGIRWDCVPLGELAKEMKIGLVRSSEEFGDAFSTPYVRMNAIGRNGEFFPELVQRTDITDDEFAEYRLEAGDFLFNTRNSKELVGKTAIFRETGDYVYNNNLMRIRFNERIDAEYVSQCFLTSFIQQELEFRKSGTTSVFAIYGRDLNTLPIPVPPINMQREFGERMRTIAASRETMTRGEDVASRLFASLQHRAFRGEL